MELTVISDESSGSAVLALAGECRVDSVAELRETLVQTLSSHNRVELDMSQVQALDISFLQLLLSADQTAKAQGKTLVRTGELPEVVREAARVCGFCSLPELQWLFPAKVCWPARD